MTTATDDEIYAWYLNRLMELKEMYPNGVSIRLRRRAISDTARHFSVFPDPADMNGGE